ncbi:MAG: hypothetical protein MZV70_07680 [Desulfobacterales bacterium]|nr:hypothetical protein [Desulfobacterales bacterium]
MPLGSQRAAQDVGVPGMAACQRDSGGAGGANRRPASGRAALLKARWLGGTATTMDASGRTGKGESQVRLPPALSADAVPRAGSLATAGGRTISCA